MATAPALPIAFAPLPGELVLTASTTRGGALDRHEASRRPRSVVRVQHVP
jgi:hypothetical protein